MLARRVDILGFGALVKDSKSKPDRISRIVKLLTTMKDELSDLGRIHRGVDGRKEKVFDSFNLSDLIVRSTRMPKGAQVSEFIDWELSYLAGKQFSLALDGVLVRGGICIGNIFVGDKKDIIFGPALNKSYVLESQHAIYPRIIIDRDIIVEAEEEGYVEHWRDSFRRGDDGAYFLDYLMDVSLASIVHPEAGGPAITGLVAKHRDMILAALGENCDKIKAKDERIKEKYIWLALYHNSTVSKLRERMGAERSRELNALRIPDVLLHEI